MKNMIFIIALFLSVGSLCAQDCEPYLPVEKGSKWEITSYSNKDKVTTRVVYELIDKVVNGAEIIFTVKTNAYDEKGKEIFTNTSEAKCIDGLFKVDLSLKIDPDLFKNSNDMEWVIDATEFTMPKYDETVGTKLEDGSIKVTMDEDLGLGMTVLVSERKVEGKEKITSPAGTFDCIKLSQKTETKMVINIVVYTKEWYAENVGMVRSESYNKKGKLTGYSVLTKLEI